MKACAIGRALVFAVATTCLSSQAYAATGVYMTGYGTQEQGMAGATIAVGQSTLAAATNPAGMAFVGNRLDVGVGVLFPDSTSSFNGQDYHMKHTPVPFPEFGYNRVINDQLSIGVTMWSAGGGASYGQPFGSIPGNSDTTAVGAYTHIAPTLAYKFDGRHAFAVSLVGALGTYKLDGAEAQTGQSNRGRDWRPGYGIRIGWLNQLTPALSLGAFYASEVEYGTFDKYRNLLPDGDLNEPAHWGLGMAYKPVPKLLMAVDYVQYMYGNTTALGNVVDFTRPLGDPKGPGFGIRDIHVWRFGLAYDLNERWTLRGGFERGQTPVTPENTAFTFAMPITSNKTYTLGATYRLNEDSTINLAYAYSPSSSVKGTGISTGTNNTTKLNYLAISYSKSF